MQQVLGEEVNGLRLHRSHRSPTGYAGVRRQESKRGGGFRADISYRGRRIHLGVFATARAAAVEYARYYVAAQELAAEEEEDEPEAEAGGEGEDDDEEDDNEGGDEEEENEAVVQQARGFRLHLSPRSST